MAEPRVILHVDMDAFFASVEQLDHPAWRGLPVLVGGTGPRAVVAAASYEARAFGCHSAQPMAVALRRCPDAVVARPRGARYRELSRQVLGILGRHAPVVEPISIDEAFLDATGGQRLFGPPRCLAARIRETVVDETGLTASVGVAPNKFLAKIASDLQKPDGLTVIDESWIEQELPRLPVGRMWGVGPTTAAALQRAGVKTFGDLHRASLHDLQKVLGSAARRIQELARGHDRRPVVTGHEARSVSHEQTFPRDLEDIQEVRAVLLRQAEAVARRLRRAGQQARRITVKIRFGDFQTITRSTTLPQPTDHTDTIIHAATALLDRWAGRGFRPVRLIGVGAGHLSDGPQQLDLFPDEAEQRLQRLERATDAITTRFGSGAIHRAGAARGGGEREG